MATMSELNNKSLKFFKKISKATYLTGSHNYWFGDLGLNPIVIILHDLFRKLVNLAMFLLLVSQLGSFFTQKNLTKKQNFDLIVLSVAQPLSLIIMLLQESNKMKIRALLKELVVKLNETYKDKIVEKKMIEVSKFYLKFNSTMILMTVLFFGIDGIMQVLRGETFVTVVTSWPDVHDKTHVAAVARIIIFVVWGLFLLRLSSVFFIVIPTAVCLSRHFTNLCSYFKRLNDVFDRDGNQGEKEFKYEKGFKVGIKMHAEILACVKKFQRTFAVVYGGQIVIKSTALITLLSALANSERSLSHLLANAVTASYTMISLGCLMWTAGQTTVEAASLPSAIFGSGWHRCTKETSRRIRPLIVFAILISQKPVVLKSFGFLPLSNKSYLSIVKSSYSWFSVLY